MKCEHCGNETLNPVRGLCGKCYQRLSTKVKRGKTTWKELEAAGVVRRARKVRNMSTKRRSELARTAFIFMRDQIQKSSADDYARSMHYDR